MTIFNSSQLGTRLNNVNLGSAQLFHNLKGTTVSPPFLRLSVPGALSTRCGTEVGRGTPAPYRVSGPVPIFVLLYAHCSPSPPGFRYCPGLPGRQWGSLVRLPQTCFWPWLHSARLVVHEEMCAHLEKTGWLSENMARPARGTRSGKQGSARGPRPMTAVTGGANAVSFGGHQSLRVPTAFPLRDSRFSPCLAQHMLYHGRQTWSSWTLGAPRAVEYPETPGENNGLIWGAFSCGLGVQCGGLSAVSGCLYIGLLVLFWFVNELL